MKKINKKLLIVALILVFAVIIILIVLYTQKPKPKQDTTTKNFTQKNLEWKSFEEELDKKGDLSQSGNQKKQNLIQQLNNKAGTLYLIKNMARIDYVPSADQFSIEIITTEVNRAKEDVRQWFLGQGFSNQDICELPILFYLSFEVKQELSAKQKTFNPLIDGCK